MTTPTGAPPSPGGAPRNSRATEAPAAVLRVPARADGIELIGELRDSGYRTPPALVRRADGQTLQLTPLLYAVLEAVDGERDLAAIAQRAGAAAGRALAESDVATLITSQLLPLGLLRRADGGQPEVVRANPLLRMRFRVAVTDPATTRRITAPFAALFSPFVVVPVLLLFAVVCWWVLMSKGLASATAEAFGNPGLLLLVFVLTLLSAGFHEFGHAAAATRGGAAPGTMGAGLYLVWPAFYTDVTDSYRLGRGGRLRTDLGGLYFNTLVAVVIAGIWLLTRDDALLLIVAGQLLMMLRQLAPIVRFDGYHILADLTGVPDLFQRIKPTLASLLPWRWGRPENRVLKPWARVVITAWVVIVVPLLLVTLVLLVLTLPRLIATAWAGAVEQQAQLAAHWGDGDIGAAAVRVLAILAIGIPVLGIGYVLIRLVRQAATGVWRKTEGRPARRAVAGMLAAAIVGGLAFAWWPSTDTYRPVQAYERGTLADAGTLLRPQGAPSGPLEAGAAGGTVALWPEGRDLPTPENPELAMVLVPQRQAAAPGDAAAGEASGAEVAPAWVFPFDMPEAPEGDDGQALAVNTEDGTVVYDVAFALVWADGHTVDTTNEAYAFASCDGCTAVAVGFQVVLIVGQADVIVPQNLAAAANYNCIDCLTYALASQLVITLDGPLSEEGAARLDQLWQEIAAFADDIRNVPLDELQQRLETYRAQIAEIVRSDPSAGAGPAEGETDTGETDTGETDTGETDPDESGDPVDPGTTTAPDDGDTADDGDTVNGGTETGDGSATAEPGAPAVPGETAAPDPGDAPAEPTEPAPEEPAEPAPSTTPTPAEEATPGP
jgi:putative peptide zinc metalloprotease protein